jgi:predicted transcriptional regulator
MDDNKILANVEKYLKVIVKILINDRVTKNITDEVHRKVYNLTGSCNRDEIAKQTEMSGGAISALWSKWEELGIIEKDGKSYKKVIN